MSWFTVECECGERTEVEAMVLHPSATTVFGLAHQCDCGQPAGRERCCARKCPMCGEWRCDDCARMPQCLQCDQTEADELDWVSRLEDAMATMASPYGHDGGFESDSEDDWLLGRLRQGPV